MTIIKSILHFRCYFLDKSFYKKLINKSTENDISYLGKNQKENPGIQNLQLPIDQNY